MEGDRPRPPLPYLTAALCARTSLEVLPAGLIVHAAVARQGASLAAHAVAAFTATAALAAPLVGVWADRVPRPVRWYRAATVVAAASYLLLARGASAPTPLVLAAAAGAGLCQPWFSSAWTSYLGRFGARGTSSSSLDVATYCVASALGPTVASAVALLDPALPLVVAAGLVLAAGLLVVRFEVPPPRPDAPARALSALARAVPATLRHGGLRRLLAVSVGVQFLAAAVVLSAPQLARSTLGSVGYSGPLVGALAVGAFVSAAVRGLTRRPRPIPPLALAAAVGGLTLGLLTHPGAAALVALLLAVGAANGLLLAELFRVTLFELPPAARAPGVAVGASLRTVALAVGTLALTGAGADRPQARFELLAVGLAALTVVLAATTLRRPGQSSPGGTPVAAGDTLRPLSQPGKEPVHVTSSERPTIAVADQSIGDEPFVRELIGDRADVRYGPLTTDAEAAELTAGADAVIVTLQRLPAERIDAFAPTVRVIGRAGVGLDTIDLGHAQAAGVAVVHEPSYATSEVATHAATLLLAVQRRLHAAAGLVDDGWGLVTELGSVPDLTEATLGLIGFGHIGRATADRMAPFVRRILWYDPFAADVEVPGATRVDTIEELLRATDLLSLHLPLTEQTRGIVGAPQLALLPAGAVVVNVSRGGLIDEAALADALHAGRLGGAGLDVFAVEPLPADSPLRGAPRLTMTPHVAWFSDDAATRMAAWTVDDVLAHLAGDEPVHGRLAVRGRTSSVSA